MATIKRFIYSLLQFKKSVLDDVGYDNGDKYYDYDNDSDKSSSEQEANAESDSSDSDFEVLEEKFLNQRRQEIHSSLYGEIGTRQATVKWFLATQAKFLRQENSTVFEEWCHGIITRK